MIKGSEVRHAEFSIDSLFIDRWSPRAMSGEAIEEELLMSLFEAAHWAPSSGNNQPWRMLYARRDSEHWPLFFELLHEGNRPWCSRAGVLVVFIAKTTLESGRKSVTHSYDCGAAWENFALQGWLKGLVVHGMAGFDYARAQESLGIPDGYQVEAMAAVGKHGDVRDLPEPYQPREKPSERRPLAETVREGVFAF